MHDPANEPPANSTLTAEADAVRSLARQLRDASPAQLARLADVEPGVATSSFQTEGELDLDGRPQTNWRAWVSRGRAERIGPACALWERYPEAARRARSLGLRVFRLSLEWARLCPDGPSVDPRVASAYARRIALLQRAGLEPVVTLQHFTHPAWAGADLWLDPQAPRLFARYARASVDAINVSLVRLGARPIARFVTINEPNMLALATYAAGVFPHERGAAADGDPLGALRSLRALDLLLAAHVRAYRALHALHAERGWPRPDVTINPNFVDVYGFSTQPLDLLRARARGVAPSLVGAHLSERREHFYRAMCGPEGDSPRGRVARSLETLLSTFVGADAYPETLALVYEPAPSGDVPTSPLDTRSIDVYDPWSYQQLRDGDALWKALSEGVLRVVHAGAAIPPSSLRLAEPWEWVCEPAVLRRALHATHNPRDPLQIDVLENGMAVCRREGEATQPRSDGVTRPRFVRGHAIAFFAARALDDLPVRAHCHWTLVDNYELGRWAPRFGLYALPDATHRGAGPWSHRDAAGHDAAGALAEAARVVTRAREGDVERARDGLASLGDAR